MVASAGLRFVMKTFLYSSRPMVRLATLTSVDNAAVFANIISESDQPEAGVGASFGTVISAKSLSDARAVSRRLLKYAEIHQPPYASGSVGGVNFKVNPSLVARSFRRSKVLRISRDFWFGRIDNINSAQCCFAKSLSRSPR